MDLNQITTIVGLTMGVSSFFGGVVMWYRGSVQKRYAAERDFNHLQRNQQQLAEAVREVADDTEKLCEQMREVKALTLSISSRLEGLAARVDGATGGWSRRE